LWSHEISAHHNELFWRDGEMIMVVPVETGPRVTQGSRAGHVLHGANATDHTWTIEELLNAGCCYGVKCEFVGRKLGISAEALRDHQGSREIVVRLDDALERKEAEYTGQEAEASTPHRQMVVSGRGPNAGPQIFLFKLKESSPSS
jgi:hypothetical protein